MAILEDGVTTYGSKTTVPAWLDGDKPPVDPEKRKKKKTGLEDVRSEAGAKPKPVWLTAAEMEAQRQNGGVPPTLPAWQSNMLRSNLVVPSVPPPQSGVDKQSRTGVSPNAMLGATPPPVPPAWVRPTIPMRQDRGKNDGWRDPIFDGLPVVPVAPPPPSGGGGGGYGGGWGRSGRRGSYGARPANMGLYSWNFNG